MDTDDTEPTASTHLSLDNNTMNTTEPMTTTCDCNSSYDTPTTLSLILIKDMNSSSSYLITINAMISDSLNSNSYKTENENKYIKTKEHCDTLKKMFTDHIEDQKEFINVLNNDNIIFEHRLNVYSLNDNCYTQTELFTCTVDAKQFNLCKQFDNRINVSGIDAVIDETIIKIIDNIDIQCDDTQQILIGNDINSLEMLFNIDTDNIIACVKGIKLEGFYDKRDSILELIFNDITNKTVYDMNVKLKEEIERKLMKLYLFMIEIEMI